MTENSVFDALYCYNLYWSNIISIWIALFRIDNKNVEK